MRRCFLRRQIETPNRSLPRCQPPPMDVCGKERLVREDRYAYRLSHSSGARAAQPLSRSHSRRGTVYMAAVIEQLKQEGYPVHGSDLAHVWPTRYAHLDVYGKYHFTVEEGWRRQ